MKNAEYEDGELSLEQEDIDYFCNHCDKSDTCSEYDKVRYVYRDLCGWSLMDGVQVYPVTKDIIGFNGVDYSRKDLDKLREAIESKKSRE